MADPYMPQVVRDDIPLLLQALKQRQRKMAQMPVAKAAAPMAPMPQAPPVAVDAYGNPLVTDPTWQAIGRAFSRNK